MTDLAKRWFPFLTYYNFVEYLVPAVFLIGVLWLNAWILLDVNLNLPNPLVTFPALFVFSVMTLGWIMYTSRFYHLFPLYRRIKNDALKRLGDIFPEQQKQAQVDSVTLGKYVFRQYWKVIEGEEKVEALRLHVHWVFLVHTSNIFMISLVVTVLALLADGVFGWPITTGNYTDMYLLFIFEFVVFVFFFHASVHRMRKSNEDIIIKVNKIKEQIGERIPVDAIKNLMA